MESLRNAERAIVEDQFGWKLYRRDGDGYYLVGTTDFGARAEAFLHHNITRGTTIGAP